MSDHPSPNWQARTLIGCYLQKQVRSLTEAFCLRLEHYQFCGGDPGNAGYLDHLCRSLQQLYHVQTLLYSVDSKDTFNAIADFRRTFESHAEADSEGTCL
jgi:hypothetical protein